MTAREELQTWVEHLSEQEARDWLRLVVDTRKASTFDFEQWHEDVRRARQALASKYGVIPSVADLVNEVNEERLDDLMGSR
jgi:hypothetical protein